MSATELSYASTSVSPVNECLQNTSVQNLNQRKSGELTERQWLYLQQLKIWGACASVMILFFKANYYINRHNKYELYL